ncbi:serine/threonine-protein kinase [Actinomadura parmotrematis]|uniref:non-specific serine/threonine protein kinase n=1 Tax=Actinomadura parmotrematis TaxID=2864039 RepID=A0ABS7FQ80_9ACTN|nr:serine/threonine-protein kinase [Actinomadura parmotrematis]MBW8482539.1 serine/threonine protein kinase [Actinomadura parmotrematis]
MADWRVTGFTEVRELGRGAQGRVVLAQHAERGTPVAIKYLTAASSGEARELFRREARLLGSVRDPHVARLYRLVESEHGLAIVMEAVDGVSYKEILGRYGTLEPEAALSVLKGSLLGLAAAHAVGVVHRDYKPANVIVPADGNSKLIDFGVATADGGGGGAGTPVYMAPEQWGGAPASPATDVYAATCVFYESVTGHRPYSGGDLAGLRRAHLEEPVPLDGVPGALRPLVERGMAKDPADRPDSAAAFVTELETTARSAYGADWESRGLRALAGTAVALAALFPLAAGLAPAGAGAGTAGGTGIMAVLGTKAGVAVAGASLATAAAAGGASVYQAAKPEPRAAVAAPSPTASPTVPLSLGSFRIAGPPGWRVRRLKGTPTNDPAPVASYRVDRARTCAAQERKPSAGLLEANYTTLCPGFAVLNDEWIHSRWGSQESYKTDGPFHPGTDISIICPPDPLGSISMAEGALPRRLTASAKPVGSHVAEYYEWRITCGDDRGRATASFVQRLWYLPRSKILVVDEWNTPGLAAMLAKAVWT